MVIFLLSQIFNRILTLKKKCVTQENFRDINEARRRVTIDPITTTTPPENNPPVSPYARLRDALATHPRTLRRPLTQEAADN
ncbi:hypothetical protein Avbf_19183 [Armadillidium vulgare]|nr:hypothetical protein Avbf_19183 [Armadillidium vulgare]